MPKKIFFPLFSILIILISLPYSKTAKADDCPFDRDTAPKRASDLIQTPQLCGAFGSDSNTYVLDPQKAPFVPYKLPTYDDLKSIYYDQKKTIPGVVTKHTLQGDQNQSSIDLTGSTDHIYYVNGNLTIQSNITQSRTGVVFVEGNLNIGPIANNKLTGNNNTGLVFVVKGNVYINTSVIQIDAVIISGGTIYTAYPNCNGPSTVEATPLTINGSLISIGENAKIILCRKPAPNAAIGPSEIINNQVKYLVILRNIYSDTLQRWSEVQ